MKNIIERIAGGAKIARYLPKAVSTRLAVAALAALAAGGAEAAINMTNPVTGATESYVNTFLGTNSSEWNAAGNWDTGSVPFVSGGVYTSALVDGEKTVTSSADIDLWHGQIGAYNGASITIPGITKIQATGGYKVFLTADRTSKIIINAFRGNQLEGSASTPIELTSAQEGGITWNCGLTTTKDSSAPFHYYLDAINNGSVVYTGNITVANEQVIKQVNIKLTGNSQVSSKTLVTFGSGTTKTFTAAAAIKVYDTDGSTLKKLVGVTAVRQSGATIENTVSQLTTANAVGTCEIVQCTDGIVLYYVDGAPSAVTGYTPSININFTNGNGLTTAGEVGLSGYAVLGMSWNNFTIPNNNTEQTFSTVAAIDSTGVASTASGVSVSVSGHRGVYYCSDLDAGSNPLHGYVDEGGATGSSTATPTVTITGIPYANYRLIVYHSTDSNNLPFGYDTINGTDFTYVDGVQAIGTTSWGNSGASDSANPIAEGVNTLVSGILSGSTATMVAHRVGTANSASVRGCFAAIQVVEVVVSDTELVIPVTGATTYTVDADKEYEKVIISGTGTLTLDGTGTITTDVLEIENNSAIVMNSSRLAATTVIGKGTAIYDGEVPPTDKGWTDSANWTGTVWIKNKSGITGNSTAGTGVQPNNLGNDKSKVKFSGVSGWLEAPITYTPEIVLENDAYDYALKLTNGNSPANKDNNDNRSTTIKKLSGSGTLCCGGSSYAWPLLKVWDSSGFTGSINTSNPDGNASGKTGMVVVFCNEDTSFSDTLYNLYNGYTRSIVVASGTTVTQTSGATWTTATGLLVDGTFNVNDALASSAATAVRGSGTVVFTGRAPTPTGDAWWKNSAWTGTVQIGDITDMIGRTSGYTGTYLDFNSYGNANSLVKLGNLTGWMDNYTCNVPVNLAGTLTINNGISGEVFTFKKLISSGGYITAPNQSATFSIRIEDGSEYAGYIGLNSKRVIFGTGTAPAFVKGQIYVSSDATITVPSVNTAYWAVGGIVVDGELKADNLARFGGGTNITTGDDGVFTLTSTGNGTEGETDTDYARIKGTGSLKYGGTGWRALTTNNLSTAVTLVNEQSGDILLSRALTYTIGSLSGSKKFQGNYGSGSRYLNIVQTKDTEWSGTITTDKDSRLAGFLLDATSTGTLTLSGTETQSATLAVNGGSVNLTGTWVGATTVAGTFGGTGTLTGDLTFNAGATFKAFASDADGLVVNGTVTYPAEGKVTVDVSALEQTGTKVLMTASGLDDSKFAPASGQSGKLSVEGNTLKVSFVTYAASYGGTDYETIQEAIDAAVADGHTFADVTILDATAECPAGYYVDTEHNNVLTKYQAAIVQNNNGAMTTNFFKTAQLAVDAIEANVMTYQYYTHFEVYSGTAVAMTINPAASDGMLWTVFSVKVKCLNSATVAVTLDSTESELTAGDADLNGIVTYTKTDKATTYVWAAAAASQWGRNTNWKVGTSDGATATRYPGAADTVIIGNGANVTGVSSATSVAALQVSGTVTIVGGGSLTSASAITLGANDSIVITGTLSPVPTTTVADSYVKATTSDSTTTYTVATQPTVSDVAFEYGDDFATATVTATVSDAAPSYKLTVGGTEYTGSVSGSTVTFSNVATGRTVAYDDVSYEIAATSGSTAVPLAGDTSGSAEISDTKTWFSHNSSGLTGGAWSNAVDLSEGPATVEDNTFTATAESTSSRVVLEFNVCFSSVSASDVDGEAQAAIKIGEVESAATFMVLAQGGSWTPVFNADLTPDPAATYKVVLTIDYGTGSYGVTVGDNALTNATGSASFPLAASKTSVQTIDFAGSGTLTSMKGDQIEGYMVKDNAGHWYATIQEATQAYNSANGPYTVLHSGTAPSGWSIVSEGGIDILKKLAKGFFFMAY